MKQPSKRFLSLLLGVAFLVAAIVIATQFTYPAYEEVRQLKAEKFSKDSFLKKEKEAVKKVRELIAANSKSDRQQLQQKVRLVLPDEPDVPGAVAQLYGLALNNNLEFTSVGFSVGGLSSAQNLKSLTPGTIDAALRRPVGTLTLSTTLKGSYDDVKRFVSQLGTNIRIFDLKSLALSVGAKTATTTVSFGVGAGATSTFLLFSTTTPQASDAYTIGIAVTTYYQGE